MPGTIPTSSCRPVMLVASHKVRRSSWSREAPAHWPISTRSITGSIRQPISTSICREISACSVWIASSVVRPNSSPAAIVCQRTGVPRGPHLVEDWVSRQIAVPGAQRPLAPLPPIEAWKESFGIHQLQNPAERLKPHRVSAHASWHLLEAAEPQEELPRSANAPPSESSSDGGPRLGNCHHHASLLNSSIKQVNCVGALDTVMTSCTRHGSAPGAYALFCRCMSSACQLATTGISSCHS